MASVGVNELLLFFEDLFDQLFMIGAQVVYVVSILLVQLRFSLHAGIQIRNFNCFNWYLMTECCLSVCLKSTSSIWRICMSRLPKRVLPLS